MAKILLIDDEGEICELLASFLELSGYEVRCCAGGYDAIEVLQHEEDDIDLVLSDVRMRNGGGVELGLWLKQHQPQKPLIFMSGVSSPCQELKNVLPGVPCFSKPLSHEKLLQKVKQLLNETPPG